MIALSNDLVVFPSEAVMFQGNLSGLISRSNLEKLKVFSFKKQTHKNCEFWSNDGISDTYNMGDFHVDISRDFARFYFGDPLCYGYFYSDPLKLYFLLPGELTPNDFEICGYDSFDNTYPIAKLMSTLVMQINEYFQFLSICFDAYNRIHSTTCKSSPDDSKKSAYDDLPF